MYCYCVCGREPAHTDQCSVSIPFPSSRYSSSVRPASSIVGVTISDASIGTLQAAKVSKLPTLKDLRGGGAYIAGALELLEDSSIPVTSRAALAQATLHPIFKALTAADSVEYSTLLRGLNLDKQRVQKQQQARQGLQQVGEYVEGAGVDNLAEELGNKGVPPAQLMVLGLVQEQGREALLQKVRKSYPCQDQESTAALIEVIMSARTADLYEPDQQGGGEQPGGMGGEDGAEEYGMGAGFRAGDGDGAGALAALGTGRFGEGEQAETGSQQGWEEGNAADFGEDEEADAAAAGDEQVGVAAGGVGFGGLAAWGGSGEQGNGSTSYGGSLGRIAARDGTSRGAAVVESGSARDDPWDDDSGDFRDEAMSREGMPGGSSALGAGGVEEGEEAGGVDAQQMVAAGGAAMVGGLTVSQWITLLEEADKALYKYRGLLDDGVGNPGGVDCILCHSSTPARTQLSWLLGACRGLLSARLWQLQEVPIPMISSTSTKEDWTLQDKVGDRVRPLVNEAAKAGKYMWLLGNELRWEGLGGWPPSELAAATALLVLVRPATLDTTMQELHMFCRQYKDKVG